MRKRNIIKILRNTFFVQKSKNEFIITHKGYTYYLKVLNVTSNHQLTVNSNIIWQSKRGIVKGIRFIATDSNLINLTEFVGFENRIIFLTSKPYKILKAVNESDLIDISDVENINDIYVTHDIEKLIDYINTNKE